MVSKVAMVTAAAHRGGKQLVHDLAAAGFDVAICSLAVLPSRVRAVESRGRRAVALKLFTTFDASARYTLDEIHRALGPVDVLVHLDGDAVVAVDPLPDATTRAVANDLVERRGCVVYVFDEMRTRLPYVVPGDVANVCLVLADKPSPSETSRALLQLVDARTSGVFELRSKAGLRSVSAAIVTVPITETQR